MAPPLLLLTASRTISFTLLFVLGALQVYETSYPELPLELRRGPARKVAYIGVQVLIIFICSLLQWMLYHQFVLPVFTSDRGISFGFAVAKLAVPSFVMWLLGFYSVFHAMLNVCGELTEYPDRRFYLEWWNATTVNDFWRKWNIPVHEFCLRHIYLESIHYKIAPTRHHAAFATFLFSALFHEYVMALVFKSLRGYFFWGMVSVAKAIMKACRSLSPAASCSSR